DASPQLHSIVGLSLADEITVDRDCLAHDFPYDHTRRRGCCMGFGFLITTAVCYDTASENQSRKDERTFADLKHIHGQLLPRFSYFANALLAHSFNGFLT